MALAKRPDPTSFAKSVNAIQRAAPNKLSIFSEEDGDEGQQFREAWDVEVLNLMFEPDKITWRKLHNDKNVEILTETEKSNRIATLTYIKFMRRIPVGEPDPEPDTFQEPCEEGDPLLDEMWGE